MHSNSQLVHFSTELVILTLGQGIEPPYLQGLFNQLLSRNLEDLNRLRFSSIQAVKEGRRVIEVSVDEAFVLSLGIRMMIYLSDIRQIDTINACASRLEYRTLPKISTFRLTLQMLEKRFPDACEGAAFDELVDRQSAAQIYDLEIQEGLGDAG